MFQKSKTLCCFSFTICIIWHSIYCINAQCSFNGIINDNGTCIQCIPGQISTSISDTCNFCTFDQIAPRRQSSECKTCGDHATPHVTHSYCICDAGYYLDDFETSDSGMTTCIKCPSGGDCSETGTVKSQVAPLRGYWRASTSHFTFHPCYFSFQCQGGYESTCLRNFDGPLCSNCALGFYRVGVTCYECPLSRAETATKLFLFIVLVIAAFITILHSVNFTVEDQFRIAQQRNAIETPQEYVEFVKQEDSRRKISFSGVTQPSTPTMVKAKLLILDYQVIAKMTTLWTREWPPAFTQISQFLDILNLDLIGTSGISCIVDENITFYTRMLWALLLPILVYVAVIIFYVIPKLFCAPEDSIHTNYSKRVRLKTIRILIFFAYVLYIPTTSTIFMIYNCVTIGDTSYLYLDLSAQCFTKEWKDWNYVAGIVGGFMLFGFPLFCQFIVGRMHDHDYTVNPSYAGCGLNEPETRIKYGTIFGAYKHDAIFVDVIEMWTRWLLVAIVPLLPQIFQALSGIIISGLFVTFILLYRPYQTPIIDRLHLLSYSNLTLIAIASLVYERIQNTAETNGSNVVVSDVVVLDIVLIIMLSSVTVTFWLHELRTLGVVGLIYGVGVHLPFVGNYIRAVIGVMEFDAKNATDSSADPLMDANFLSRKQSIPEYWPRLDRLGILEDSFVFLSYVFCLTG